MKDGAANLRSNPLWKEAYSLAEYFYEKISVDFVDIPDEKYNTERKLRSSANDALFYVAQAVGSTMSDTSEFDWSYARKSLFAAQTMYSFASKQGYTELDPSIMVRIDKLLTKIDFQIANSKKEKNEREKKDLEPWLEKYRLWKIIADDKKPKTKS